MDALPSLPSFRPFQRVGAWLLLLWGLLPTIGCYAPLHSPAIPAATLPDIYRTPTRAVGTPLNFANLTLPPPKDYTLGPDDVLEVTVPDLYRDAAIRPMQVQIMSSGEVHLPLVGSVHVAGMNLLQAQQAITERYGDGFFESPRVNVSLFQPATVNVLVLGEVAQPGVHALPKFQNDVGHALAAAGGMTEDADQEIEVHRRLSGRGMADEPVPGGELIAPGPVVGDMTILPNPNDGEDCLVLQEYQDDPGDPKAILRIPLRGLPPGALQQRDITLHAGDVVVVPSRRNEVFWVVGKLSQSNLVRFTLGNRERELGAGLVLPRDRDIDVVTAVAMAGYIDPIDSPTTVTVHRTLPNGEPMLIRVDLIAARYDRRETVMVQPGDIIYVNPDFPWWFRRTFDRVVDDFLVIPYGQLVLKVFGRGQ